MPQFNAKSLARVLVQVEREVLVEALEIAELEQILLTPHLATLQELGEFFNLIANVKVFGFQAIEEILVTASKELGPTTLALGEFIIEQFVRLADIGDVGTASSEKLDELITIGEILIEAKGEVIPQEIPTAQALLQTAADDLRLSETLITFEQDQLRELIINARAKIEAAFAILTEFIG